MKISIWILFFPLVFANAFAEVYISEIMYNPEGNDFDFEYIEIYGEENLSGWSFEGINFIFPDNVTINGYEVISNTLFDEGEDNDFLDRYPETECRFEYTGSLLNTGETIILRDNEGKIKDVVTYGDWAIENYSLEKVNLFGLSSDPDNWAMSNFGGSPGRENSVASTSGCDWELELVMEDTVTEDPEWKIRAKKISGEGKVNITINHWIEDSFGRIERAYADINIENSVSQSTSNRYSPPLVEGEGFIIKANITSISCEDINANNNFISELIFIREEEILLKEVSNLTIIGYSDSAHFGDIVSVQIKTYRGNTSKYAVYLYIKGNEIVSEKSTVHVRDRYITQTLTIPIQLKPNCDNRYKEGDYIIILEGIEADDSKEIFLTGTNSKLCKTVESKKDKKKGKFSYRVESLPYQVSVNEEFEIKLLLENDEDDDVELEIWSYVYRGPKKYSDEYANLIYVSIDEGEDLKISLPITVIEGDEGVYKLKTKIRKKGRKTTYDKTKEIEVIVPKKEETMLLESSPTLKNDPASKVIEERIIRDEIVYESESFFIKKLIPYILVVLLLLAIIVSLTIIRE